jgi:DNA excision repair protein ERCC-3
MTAFWSSANTFPTGEFGRGIEPAPHYRQTKHVEREALYADFKAGRIKVLDCLQVANFAVDLPDASVLIQVSGTFGSRQEEAQRLGRILRPKQRSSHFYTLVSKGTTEQSFAVNRQLFLVEQGYKYQIRYFE